MTDNITKIAYKIWETLGLIYQKEEEPQDLKSPAEERKAWNFWGKERVLSCDFIKARQNLLDSTSDLINSGFLPKELVQEINNSLPKGKAKTEDKNRVYRLILQRYLLYRYIGEDNPAFLSWLLIGAEAMRRNIIGYLTQAREEELQDKKTGKDLLTSRIISAERYLKAVDELISVLSEELQPVVQNPEIIRKDNDLNDPDFCQHKSYLASIVFPLALEAVRSSDSNSKTNWQIKPLDEIMNIPIDELIVYGLDKLQRYALGKKLASGQIKIKPELSKLAFERLCEIYGFKKADLSSYLLNNMAVSARVLFQQLLVLAEERQVINLYQKYYNPRDFFLIFGWLLSVFNKIDGADYSKMLAFPYDLQGRENPNALDFSQLLLCRDFWIKRIVTQKEEDEKEVELALLLDALTFKENLLPVLAGRNPKIADKLVQFIFPLIERMFSSDKIAQRYEKNPLASSEITPPRMILFSGPPGSGKTAVATYCGKVLKEMFRDKGREVYIIECNLQSVNPYVGNKIDDVIFGLIDRIMQEERCSLPTAIQKLEASLVIIRFEEAAKFLIGSVDEGKSSEDVTPAIRAQLRRIFDTTKNPDGGVQFTFQSPYGSYSIRVNTDNFLGFLLASFSEREAQQILKAIQLRNKDVSITGAGINIYKNGEPLSPTSSEDLIAIQIERDFIRRLFDFILHFPKVTSEDLKESLNTPGPFNFFGILKKELTDCLTLKGYQVNTLVVPDGQIEEIIELIIKRAETELRVKGFSCLDSIRGAIVQYFRMLPREEIPQGRGNLCLDLDKLKEILG